MTEQRWPNGAAQTPATGCPVCFHLLDAASSTDEPNAMPAVGDITVCMYCSAILEFDQQMLPVRLSAQTEASLPMALKRQILSISAAVQSFQRRPH